jgi:hypothetical protein
MLAGNALECGCFLNVWTYFVEIERCAIPNSATLPARGGEGIIFAWFAVHFIQPSAFKLFLRDKSAHLK